MFLSKGDKSMKKMMMLVLISMLVFITVGCNGNISKEKEALAIIVGNHSCSKEVNFNSTLITGFVKRVLDSYGYISLISGDGRPSVISSNSYDIPEQYKNAAKEKLESDNHKKAKMIMKVMSQIKADDVEVDTLEAIRLAARSLSDISNDVKKTILIIDTGLSTEGVLNFRNNLLSAQPEMIAETLAEKKEIPNLTGISVYWAQIGDTAEPQLDLPQAQIEQLKKIWQSIIVKGGGSVEFSDSLPGEGILKEGLPEVSPVEIIIDSPIQFEMTDSKDMNFQEPVFLSEKQVQFKGDSAEYLEPDKVESELKPVIDILVNQADLNLLLIGTTAGDEDGEYTKELSLERAEAVKRSLMSQGIQGERLKVIGLGSSDPWHIYGQGTKGELASQNRKVVLLNSNTEIAQSLLENNN